MMIFIEFSSEFPLDTIKVAPEFIQYMARILPWYSLRGLHIIVFLLGFPYMVSISFGVPYMVMLQAFKRKCHCSGCGVARGCYKRSIVPWTAIVTSQCYDRYCFTEYARTWVGHLSTPWQRDCTAITGRQSIDNLSDFKAICCIFLGKSAAGADPLTSLGMSDRIAYPIILRNAESTRRRCSFD